MELVGSGSESEKLILLLLSWAEINFFLVFIEDEAREGTDDFPSVVFFVDIVQKEDLSEIILIDIVAVNSASLEFLDIVAGDSESLVVGFADDEIVVSFNDSGSDFHI
jgi:hypothetical protein